MMVNGYLKQHTETNIKNSHITLLYLNNHRILIHGEEFKNYMINLYLFNWMEFNPITEFKYKIMTKIWGKSGTVYQI